LVLHPRTPAFEACLAREMAVGLAKKHGKDLSEYRDFEGCSEDNSCDLELPIECDFVLRACATLTARYFGPVMIRSAPYGRHIIVRFSVPKPGSPLPKMEAFRHFHHIYSRCWDAYRVIKPKTSFFFADNENSVPHKESYVAGLYRGFEMELRRKRSSNDSPDRPVTAFAVQKVEEPASPETATEPTNQPPSVELDPASFRAGFTAARMNPINT
jgi:hypothetical protein